MKRPHTAVFALVCMSLGMAACDDREAVDPVTGEQEFRSGTPIASFFGTAYDSYPKPADRDNLLDRCTLSFEVHDGSGTVVLDELEIGTWEQPFNGAMVDKMGLVAVLTAEGVDFFDDRDISRPATPPGGQLTYLAITVQAGLNWPGLGQTWIANVRSAYEVGTDVEWESVHWDGDLEVVSDCS